MDGKICPVCKLHKPSSDFGPYNPSHAKPTIQSYCRTCKSKYTVDLRHRTGRVRPMQEAKDCSSYLGIYVAERVLSKFFNHITRMPINNPGYDFLCDKGFKIDVKSSCLHETNHGTTAPRWEFHSRKNKETDFFLCLGFNNREDLEPWHVWLIPGKLVNTQDSFSITNSQIPLANWAIYEKPLDKVLECCAEMRESIHG